MYPIIDLTTWAVMAEEGGGEGRDKRWVAETPDAGREAWWLWKPAKQTVLPNRHSASAEIHTWVDHWVERIVADLASLLDVPCAPVELASLGDTQGSISASIIPADMSRREGDTLLSELNDYLPLQSQRTQGAGAARTGYTIEAIEQQLRSYKGPPDTHYAIWDAYDVFVGYLVLDAWISNNDRHALNWMVLHGEHDRRLAATFDHGSAMGSGMVQRRHDLLGSRIHDFVDKSRSRRFEDPSESLVALAHRGEQLGSARAHHWRAALRDVSPPMWRGILEQVPGLSEPLYTFMDELLRENKRRLCRDA